MMVAVNRRGKAIRPDAQEVSNIDLPEGKNSFSFLYICTRFFHFKRKNTLLAAVVIFCRIRCHQVEMTRFHSYNYAANSVYRTLVQSII